VDATLLQRETRAVVNRNVERPFLKLSLRENIATSETQVRAMLALYERKEKEKEANEKEKRGREKDGVEANFYSSEAEYLF